MPVIIKNAPKPRRARGVDDLVPASVSTMPDEKGYQRALIGYKNGGQPYAALAPLFTVGDVMDLDVGRGGVWKGCEIMKTLDPKHPHWDITVVCKVPTKNTFVHSKRSA